MGVTLKRVEAFSKTVLDLQYNGLRLTLKRVEAYKKRVDAYSKRVEAYKKMGLGLQ